MAKFVKVPIQDTLVSSTSTGTTADKLVDSGQTFTSSVSVGDEIYNVTDGTYATITAIDSDTVLSISADVVPTGKSYIIYDVSSASVEKIISAERFLLSENATAATANAIGSTTVSYASGGKDVLTITHTPIASEAMVSSVESAMLKAFSNNIRPEVNALIELPSGVKVFSLALA